MILDLVVGTTLADHIKSKNRCDFYETLPLILQICRGVEFAHEANIIHRDLKPTNILLENQTNGQVLAKISDFGIAKTVNDTASPIELTKTGDIFGSPQYMSPEQASGNHVDKRSDIYSIGCIIFELLTGAPPFEGSSSVETLFKQLSEKPRTLSAAAQGSKFPQQLESIVQKCLAKTPADRFNSTGELIEELESLRKEDSKTVHEDSKNSNSANKKNIALFAVLTGLLAVSLGAVFTLAMIQRKSNQPTAPATQTNGLVTTTVVEKKRRVNQLTTTHGENDALDVARTINTGKTAELDLRTMGVVMENSYLAPLLTKTDFSGLRISGKGITDDAVKYLEKLELTLLDISNTSIDSRGICKIASNKKTRSSLKSLFADNTKIGDPGLECLAKLTHLETLNLSNDQEISSRGLFNLARLTKLAQLDLENCSNVKEEFLDKLVKLPITTLNLSNLKFKSGWDSLAKMHHLNSLNLRGTLAENKDVESICASHRNLRDLTLSTERSDEDSLASLKELKSLQKLDISGCPRTNSHALDTIANLQNLESLNVRNMKLDLQDAKVIANLRKLKTLDLSHSSFPRGFTSAIASLPNLQTLILAGTPTGNEVPEALQHSKLLSLDLSDTGVNQLSALTKVPTLMHLSILNCKVSQQEIDRLREPNPHLSVQTEPRPQ